MSYFFAKVANLVLMIGWLSGKIQEKIGKDLVIAAGGVGYRVAAVPEVLSRVAVGERLELFIHPHIKEDAFDLYGFVSKKELHLFELLISVSGVGPKTALLILGSGKVEEVLEAITRADYGFFTATPGIGTKMAQRIVVDLRSKVGAVGDLDLSAEEVGERKQLTEALKTFGFTERECREVLKSLPREEGLTLEQKIKWALKSLGR